MKELTYMTPFAYGWPHLLMAICVKSIITFTLRIFEASMSKKLKRKCIKTRDFSIEKVWRTLRESVDSCWVHFADFQLQELGQVPGLAQLGAKRLLTAGQNQYPNKYIRYSDVFFVYNSCWFAITVPKSQIFALATVATKFVLLRIILIEIFAVLFSFRCKRAFSIRT